MGGSSLLLLLTVESSAPWESLKQVFEVLNRRFSAHSTERGANKRRSGELLGMLCLYISALSWSTTSLSVLGVG
jgi:hypothetical protein